MKKLCDLVLVAVMLSVMSLGLVTVGPVGCSNATKVSETSVYKGDAVLYNVEKWSVEAHKNFKDFLAWERTYRAVLPVEVSRAADFIRVNEERWANTVNALHDAYEASPTGENRDKLKLSLNLLRAGLDQAVLHMAANASKAPNTGLKDIGEPKI